MPTSLWIVWAMYISKSLYPYWLWLVPYWPEYAHPQVHSKSWTNKMEQFVNNGSSFKSQATRKPNLHLSPGYTRKDRIDVSDVAGGRTSLINPINHLHRNLLWCNSLIVKILMRILNTWTHLNMPRIKNWQQHFWIPCFNLFKYALNSSSRTILPCLWSYLRHFSWRLLLNLAKPLVNTSSPVYSEAQPQNSHDFTWNIEIPKLQLPPSCENTSFQWISICVFFLHVECMSSASHPELKSWRPRTVSAPLLSEGPAKGQCRQVSFMLTSKSAKRSDSYISLHIGVYTYSYTIKCQSLW